VLVPFAAENDVRSKQPHRGVLHQCRSEDGAARALLQHVCVQRRRHMRNAAAHDLLVVQRCPHNELLARRSAHNREKLGRARWQRQ
jgi:hypothetical protein